MTRRTLQMESINSTIGHTFLCPEKRKKLRTKNTWKQVRKKCYGSKKTQKNRLMLIFELCTHGIFKTNMISCSKSNFQNVLWERHAPSSRQTKIPKWFVNCSWRKAQHKISPSPPTRHKMSETDLYPWQCLRPDWMGIWETWSKGRFPCPLQGEWNFMIFKVRSNINLSMILWSYINKYLKLTLVTLCLLI